MSNFENPCAGCPYLDWLANDTANIQAEREKTLRKARDIMSSNARSVETISDITNICSQTGQTPYEVASELWKYEGMTAEEIFRSRQEAAAEIDAHLTSLDDQERSNDDLSQLAPTVCMSGIQRILQSDGRTFEACPSAAAAKHPVKVWSRVV